MCPWEVIWRVICKIYPVKSTQIFQGACLIFFLIYRYDTPFFSGCSPEKNLGRFYRVDFTGYPSNQLSGYRLNGRVWKTVYHCENFEVLNRYILWMGRTNKHVFDTHTLHIKRIKWWKISRSLAWAFPFLFSTPS